MVEALELLGPNRPRGGSSVATACAQVEAQLGGHREARRRMLAALEHAPPGGRAAIDFELATNAMMHNEKLEELREWAEHAARAATGDPLLAAGADALRALAASLTVGADADAAARWLDCAVARLAGLDDSALAAYVHVPLQIGRAQLRLQRFTGALETFDRALSVALGSHQGQMLVHLRAVRAITRWLLLDLDGALVEVDAAEEGARLNGAPHQLLIALWLRAMVQHHRGEADAAERAAQEFSALARTYPRSALIHNAACNVATIHVDRDPERAIRDMLAAAGSDLRHTDYYWGSSLLLALVRAAIAAGRLEDAERWMAGAATRDSGLGLPASEVRASCARAEILLARGAAREAAEVAERGGRGRSHPRPDGRHRRAPARGPRARGGGRDRAGEGHPAAGGLRRRARRGAAAAQRRPARATAPRHACVRRGPARRPRRAAPSASAASPS